ncbi:hypothetical protein TD95_003528 [Thielaviopsis punctulata]|uniref:glycogenin glucosyltransferase n=1 Tax=Thielaviopsis punctulata TaxID=72032 RepID=A0A0F4ZH07_9PEZI|nr:hypothetical protein TD95_003528 [Thielaviopsis punctulata]
MASQVYATLLTNNSYLPGALVLANSLRDAGSTKEFAVLVTPETVSADTIAQLRTVYNHIIEVPRISNPNATNLAMMQRLDLHSTLTKIELWKQTQFSKIVYIDADVVAVRAPDELFDLEVPFAAAPDIGWPDCFNSGVMVLKPDMETYNGLKAMAAAGATFDGADQGLLNAYFPNFHRISFTYNVTPSAHYQYLPAYNHFRANISLVHFIGKDKPWVVGRGAATSGSTPYHELAGKWFAVFDRHYGVQGRSGAQLKDIEAVRRMVAGESGSYYSPSGYTSWDPSRSAPPMNSGPEAGNLPAHVYSMSTDTTPYNGRIWVGDNGYHAAVFPWEQEHRQTVPTRVFWEDRPEEIEEVYEIEPVEAEAEPIEEDRCATPTQAAPTPAAVAAAPTTAMHDDYPSDGYLTPAGTDALLASYTTTPTMGASEGPSTPPPVDLTERASANGSADPWAGLNMSNAWDAVPQITRYFEQRNASAAARRGIMLRPQAQPKQADWTCVHGHHYEPMDCLCEIVNTVYGNEDPLPELKRLLRAYRTTVPAAAADANKDIVSPKPRMGHTHTENVRAYDDESPLVSLAEGPAAHDKHRENMPMYTPSYLGPGVAWDKDEAIPRHEVSGLPPSEEELDVLQS